MKRFFRLLTLVVIATPIAIALAVGFWATCSVLDAVANARIIAVWFLAEWGRD